MSNEQRITELQEKIIKINSVSPTLCTAKWLQTTLYLQNGYNHSCHHPSPHKIPLEEIENNPSALHNSKWKKAQRKLMLEGKRPPECSYCWNTEDLNKNYFSDRHYKTADTWAWDRFDEIAASDPDDDVYPSYLEISFSNACNFACAYCSPDISSKWMEDIQANGPYPISNGAHHLDYLKSMGKMPYKDFEHNPYVEAFWKWFPDALPHLKVLRITGGEPTLSVDFWKLLDYLIDNPCTGLEFAVNTNGCVPVELIDKLILKINVLSDLGMKVDVYTSLESVEEQIEYVRDGLNYQEWINNVDRILTETTSTVNVMTTINILSLPKFINFIELIMDFRVRYNHDFAYNRIPISINYLHWPPFLQCSVLGESDRICYADAIEEHCKKWLKYFSPDKYARLYLEEWDQINRLCDYLRTTPTKYDDRIDFVDFINEYDTRRNKSFKDIFPEYKHLLTEWNI